MLCVCTIYMIVLTEERTMSDPLELQLWNVVSHPMLVVLGSSTRATLTVCMHIYVGVLMSHHAHVEVRTPCGTGFLHIVAP